MEIAELICKALPSVQRLRFVSSGTEATMSAIRLARGATARDEWIKVEGCYHGHADALLVAINSDDSVRRLKGEGRPVNPLERRMAVLAALECVDWVVPFSEDTPERLICRASPDVLVKGGDYSPGEIAGHDCVMRSGGEVVVLDYEDGCSTSEIIDRIRRQE